MKKVCLILLLPLMLMLCACGDNNVLDDELVNHTKEIEFYDKDKGFKTIFTYDDNIKYSDIEVVDDKDNDNLPTTLEFDNDDLDVEIDMSYSTLNKSLVSATIDSHKNDTNYREYIFGNYSAFTYGSVQDAIELYVILSDNLEASTYDLLSVTINRLDDDDTITVSDVFNGKELQALFKSIKFEKVSTKKD